MRRAQRRAGGAVRILLIACLVVGLIASLVTWRWMAGPASPAPIARAIASETETPVDEATEQQIRAFCGDCHALPRPTSFPRDAWHAEVQKGYEFYSKSGRTDLQPPPMTATVAWYRSRAPQQFVFTQPPESNAPLATSFRVTNIPVESGAAVIPAVSHFHWLSLAPGADPVLVVCDMRGGTINTLSLQDPAASPRTLVRLKNPCHVEPCDLDNNGTIDLVVADLGSFLPADHQDGRVVYLPQDASGEFGKPVVLAAGLGRVADVRPVDVDRDGDLDLIVAVFGFHLTGKTVLMRNVSSTDGALRFEMEELDCRPGTSHLGLADLNRDGRTDIVAVISQEYEQLVMYINQEGLPGSSRPFRTHTIWAGPDLTYGLDGMELVDLDSDGDLDVLCTNGDSFDNFYLNPSHGIQWFENDGEAHFTHHRLTDLPGAYHAKAGDIDGDGDLDIIGATWIPANAKPDTLAVEKLPSIICLEQTERGTFVRHNLKVGCPKTSALILSDFDRDGDLDFAVSAYKLDASSPLPYWVAIWWNEKVQ